MERSKRAPIRKTSTIMTTMMTTKKTTMDVREGASGTAADAPGVGLEIVSGLKLLQKVGEKRGTSKTKMKKL